jgi:hypothetical protein
MNAPYMRTKFQQFTSDLPHTSFKKLVVLTLRLLRNLHMMSLAKAVSDSLKYYECKRNALCKCSLIPYFPKKDCVQETVLSFEDNHLKMQIGKFNFLSGTLGCIKHFSFMWDQH